MRKEEPSPSEVEFADRQVYFERREICQEKMRKTQKKNQLSRKN